MQLEQRPVAVQDIVEQAMELSFKPSAQHDLDVRRIA